MKYQPIFDLDNKIISIYNDLNLFSEEDFNPDINNLKNELNEKEENNYISKILFFFLILFLILILLVLSKKIFDYYKRGKSKEKNESQLLEFQDMGYNKENTN